MATEQVEAVRAVTMYREAYVFRITIVGILLAVAFGIFSSWFFHLQITRHEELHAKARLMYTTHEKRVGNRGAICDRRGHVLVGNKFCKDVRADLTRMPDEQLPYIISCIAGELAVDRALLERRFYSRALDGTRTYKEVVVKNGVDIADAARLSALKLPGIRFLDSQRRVYPKDEMLANVLGFVNIDYQGVYGIESLCNESLSPNHGEITYEHDRQGRPLHRGTLPQQQVLDGKSVYLTIEEPIQYIVEKELRAMVEEFVPERAYAIMANPRTGAIMAMAQWPTYNPNDRTEMAPSRWRNHMVSEVCEPGSTMKCIAIAGAIDYGVVDLETEFDCEHGLWYYCRTPLRDSHGHGILNVSDIICKSSNIGTAKIGVIMGKNRLFQTLRRFGFGKPTGIGFDDESAGLLRRPAKWDCLSVTRFPIGQGVSVTPLQMTQAYCALANNGEMPQLHLIDRIISSDAKVEAVVPPPHRLVLRGNTASKIVSAMVRVTQPGGTGRKAAVPGHSVAGKTGTSQKLVNGSYSGHGKFIASFIGFAPASDPAFVLLVMADSPSTGTYYGGAVAAPTFSRIAEQTLRYLAVPPDLADQMAVNATTSWPHP
jgi:cell division protein FtsI (penicillin-binding protein 3)